MLAAASTDADGEKMILRRGGEKLKICGGTPRPLSRRSRGLENAGTSRNLHRVGGWGCRTMAQAAPTRMASRSGRAEARTAATRARADPPTADDNGPTAEGGRRKGATRIVRRDPPTADNNGGTAEGGRRKGGTRQGRRAERAEGVATGAPSGENK